MQLSASWCSFIQEILIFSSHLLTCYVLFFRTRLRKCRYAKCQENVLYWWQHLHMLIFHFHANYFHNNIVCFPFFLSLFKREFVAMAMCFLMMKSILYYIIEMNGEGKLCKWMANDEHSMNTRDTPIPFTVKRYTVHDGCMWCTRENRKGYVFTYSHNWNK